MASLFSASLGFGQLLEAPAAGKSGPLPPVKMRPPPRAAGAGKVAGKLPNCKGVDCAFLGWEPRNHTNILNEGHP